MSYKSILAVIDEPAEARQVLDVVSKLAQQFDAHIIGVHADPESDYRSLPALDVAYPVDLDNVAIRSRDRAARIEAAFNERVRSEGFASEWHHIDTPLAQREAAVDRLSRSCDLIVVRQPDAHSVEGKFRRCEHLLFDSGRPVLMVPYILKDVRNIRRVLVGWNGMRESARAVFDALPFLMAADKVEIVSVETERNRGSGVLPAGTDLAATLARHGVNVIVSREMAVGIAAATVIENRVADTGADLLVLGAYSHSRLRERVFGGVTREALSSMTTLTLMAR